MGSNKLSFHCICTYSVRVLFIEAFIEFVSQNRVFSWRDTIISVLKLANSLRLGFPFLH